MTDGDPEIVDRSRVDAYATTRRRAMLLHSVWRPMLAGAVGAALVIAAVYVTLPKISYREIEIPRVTMRDVTVPNIVAKDVTVDHVITRDVIVEIPRVVTPTEKAFIDSPAFSNAEIKGRIVASPDGISLAFDTGNSWSPVDPNRAADSAPYIGLWGYCAPVAGTNHFHCFVLLRDGTVISVPQRPVGRPT